MSSAPTDCRVPATPDPADKLDAKADGNFGNHRAGYSPDKLANAEYWARKGGTLNAGEGAILCAEIDRLRRILAALREPSEAVVVACAKALRQHHEGVTWCTWEDLKEQTRQRMMDEVLVVLSSAVAAAEQEVSNDAG